MFFKNSPIKIWKFLQIFSELRCFWTKKREENKTKRRKDCGKDGRGKERVKFWKFFQKIWKFQIFWIYASRGTFDNDFYTLSGLWHFYLLDVTCHLENNEKRSQCHALWKQQASESFLTTTTYFHASDGLLMHFYY